jgi:DNA-directed RNA polymerases I, II, and III subunit RPABC3
MSENIIFEGSFKVKDINSQKYDRVSRIKAESEPARDVEIHLDVNTELYPLNTDERFTMAMALSLNLDGSKDDGKGYRVYSKGEQTLADDYDYVCYGKIYRFEEGAGDNM